MEHTCQQSSSLVEFTLKHPEQIEPIGIEPYQSMSWFNLTDSHYYLNLGTIKLYEYSEEIKRQNNTRFVDYYLVRFIEDFTEMFPHISTDVSKNYCSTLGSYANPFEYYNKQRINCRSNLDWITCRILSNNHLELGPGIGFFKCRNEIKIIWKADQTIHNKAVWSAGCGTFSMSYDEFVTEVESFGARFFEAMELQIDIALQKDWSPIHFNEITLINEQLVRKAGFYKSLILLKGGL